MAEDNLSINFYITMGLVKIKPRGLAEELDAWMREASNFDVADILLRTKERKN
jgi:hypothetical protein